MNFKTLLPRLVGILLLLSFSIFQACDDDEPKDTLAPEVSITNITANMDVWNTVTLDLDASDNSALSQVEMFVDGNLISSDAEEPFEFSWDSNTVADGAHAIKVVATDKSGNATEKAVTVNVLNTLVTFTIGANQLNLDPDWAERGFVFLSDADGKLIASQEYFNGNSITMKSSNFNGEKFYLTEVLREKTGNGDEFRMRMWTFASIERGKNWILLDDRDEEDETFAGNATLNLTNHGNFMYLANSNGGQAYFGEFDPSKSIRLLKSPSLLYIVRLPADNQTQPVPEPTYNLYSGITLGNNAINLSAVNKPLTKKIVTFPANSYDNYVEVSGYPVANNFTDEYRLALYSSVNTQFPVFYPGTAFASYYTELSYETDKMYYNRGTTSTDLALPGIVNDVDFTFTSNKLSYTATGNADMLSTFFFNSTETVYWSVVLPLISTATTIPNFEIPTTLQGFNVPVFSLPSYFTVYDFEGITNYEGMKNYIRTSEKSIDGLYDDGKNYVDINYFGASSPGGRSKTVHKFKTFGKPFRK
jgi:hypothetical protein